MVEKHESIDNSQPVNEIIKIEISRDKMLGVVWFEEPKNGGRQLSADQIKVEIEKKGINQGVILEVLNEITKNRRYEYKYIIAKGVQPQDGEDA
ncbi:MAG: hypothetical protein K0S30_1853, partial [Clostridia bacterium]|nr:hypothetical protein [Clostridia bacterium]